MGTDEANKWWMPTKQAFSSDRSSESAARGQTPGRERKDSFVRLYALVSIAPTDETYT